MNPARFSATAWLFIWLSPLSCAAPWSSRQGGLSTLDTRMLEQPAVSAERVAFVYASDLWVAKLDGSGVQRLTTHPGREARPRFSPDGKWIAFSGQYDGNMDVYVVSAEGGEPRRLTWHPGDDVVQDFTPDGKEVLFTSQRDVYTRRFWHLFRVPVTGGFPVNYELPTCAKAAISADGKKIAYVPLNEAFTQWKNYRGGTASRIWIYDVATRDVAQVPQPAGRCNDSDPMWIGQDLYFRSDREGEFNLYRFDAAGKAVTRLTDYAEFPVENPTAGGGRIAFENAGYLYTYSPSDRQTQHLTIGVAADLIETRARFVKGDEYVRSASPSPSGARAAFGFRGEIVTVPAEKGDPRNLTNSPGDHERNPSWSPDGKTIAWYSDDGGENKLVLAPQDGKGERRVLALTGAGFYEPPKWSPDSKKLSYVDNARALYVLDVESGKAVKVAQEPIYGVFQTLVHNWSPDSRWLAYTLVQPTGFKRVELYDVKSGEVKVVTDGLADAAEPTFDTGGKYLYLTASTDAGPFVTWFSQASGDIEQTNSLYLICLAKDTPSPFAKESDEEALAAESKKADKATESTAAESKKDEPKKDDAKKDEPKKEGDAAKAVPDVKIDFDGLAQRIVAFPLTPAYYSNLVAGDAGQLYYRKSERASFDGEGPEGPRSALTGFTVKTRKEKKILDGVEGFGLTADRKKILFRDSGGFWLVPMGDAIDKSKGPLAVAAIQVKIEPREEWREIFDDVWRINRDYFYDPAMHGANWNKMKEKYAQFLPHLTTRGDLNRVLRWLCSELAVGHSNVGGGDTLVKIDAVPGGLLGADYAIDSGRYRFGKIYGGLNWTPDLRAPLTEPGVDVKEGDFLLAVNGKDLKAADNLYERFEQTAGKQTELTVGPNADGTASRTVKVVPIDNEASLRNRDWVEGNIRKVTDATHGRVAYVYVPNTADLGFIYFKRYFFPQSNRQAIILDERHNGGGAVADYYIDILRRPYVAHWATRYGASIVTPQAAIFGPKVMIIDETAGSGGDLLPWMFRKFGLGKLIGRPTWGGLVGILGFPELMDGGRVTAPNLGIWTEEEGFTVENVGVPPDIEVEQLPALVQDGHDPQLERAIQEILTELDKNPPHVPKQPPFPVRVRK